MVPDPGPPNCGEPMLVQAAGRQALQEVAHVIGLLLQLCLAAGGQRRLDEKVEQPAEHQQQDQGGAGAPQHQPPADSTQQARVTGLHRPRSRHASAMR
jgi:hypothetical protein